MLDTQPDSLRDGGDYWSPGCDVAGADMVSVRNESAPGADERRLRAAVRLVDVAARRGWGSRSDSCGTLGGMDPTLLTKILAGGLGLTCTMVLALTGKIDGPTAMQAVTTITGVFLGSAAVLGVGQAVAGAMNRKAPEAKPEAKSTA